MRGAIVFTALLAFAPLPAAANEDGPPQLQEAMLRAHNEVRREFGSPPLGWDQNLARDALHYATVLADTSTFRHDPQSGAEQREGENLFMGTAGAYPYDDMARYWIEERQSLRPGRFPDVSRTGNWADVGHFTQMVWPETTRVGCAVAANRSDEYLVCRYLPAGNVNGTLIH